MSREPEVALVLSADEWVDALHRHCADHGGARVRCLVLDPAVALDEEFDVLVTSDRWPALTRPFVDALHQRGRRVLAVGDAARGADVAWRLGVDRLVAAATPSPGLVDAVVALAGPGPTPASPDPVADPVADPVPRASDRPGFVVVGGPRGAGSTEIALGLAARCVRVGDRPVVVDADGVAPSVALRLGLPLEPNLCTAVDAVAYGLGGVPGALFDLGADWPVVLVGVPNRRVAVAGSEVVAVAEVLAQRFAPVIVDVSAAEGRGGPDDVGSTLLARAGLVVAVGLANPVGIVQLGGWLDEVRAVAGAVPIHAVVNRAPAQRSRRAEIVAELRREARLGGLTFVPGDPRIDDAVWSASLVDRGPFVRAVETVHQAVLSDRTRTGGLVGAA